MEYLFKGVIAIVGATGWYEIFKDGDVYTCHLVKWNQYQGYGQKIIKIRKVGKRWTHDSTMNQAGEALIELIKDYKK